MDSIQNHANESSFPLKNPNIPSLTWNSEKIASTILLPVRNKDLQRFFYLRKCRRSTHMLLWSPKIIVIYFATIFLTKVYFNPLSRFPGPRLTLFSNVRYSLFSLCILERKKNKKWSILRRKKPEIT